MNTITIWSEMQCKNNEFPETELVVEREFENVDTLVKAFSTYAKYALNMKHDAEVYNSSEYLDYDRLYCKLTCGCLELVSCFNIV